MKCPFCRDLENKVIDSRLGKDGDLIRRRRECLRCERRFTTYERVEEMLPMIVKKDGRREIYERLKVTAGLKKACEKRPVSMETIEQTADRIERMLQERGEKEVSSSVIGEAIMRALYDLDKVAYVRFASVYRSFEDVNEFMRELKDLIQTTRDQGVRKSDRAKTNAPTHRARSRRSRSADS
jgi:transcriptional repressor NrdR